MVKRGIYHTFLYNNVNFITFFLLVVQRANCANIRIAGIIVNNKLT